MKIYKFKIGEKVKVLDLLDRDRGIGIITEYLGDYGGVFYKLQLKNDPFKILIDGKNYTWAEYLLEADSAAKRAGHPLTKIFS